MQATGVWANWTREYRSFLIGVLQPYLWCPATAQLGLQSDLVCCIRWKAYSWWAESSQLCSGKAACLIEYMPYSSLKEMDMRMRRSRSSVVSYPRPSSGARISFRTTAVVCWTIRYRWATIKYHCHSRETDSEVLQYYFCFFRRKTPGVCAVVALGTVLQRNFLK